MRNKRPTLRPRFVKKEKSFDCETCKDTGKVLVSKNWHGEAYGELVEEPCPDCQE